MELEQITPVPDNELQQAVDMLENFTAHWERLEGDDESRHDLVKLIVHRVYVVDEKVVAMTLHSNYHLVLNHKTNGPTEFSVDPLGYTCGSDGTHFVKYQFQWVDRWQLRSHLAFFVRFLPYIYDTTTTRLSSHEQHYSIFSTPIASWFAA